MEDLSRADRVQRAALWTGAALDAAFGAPLLLAPAPAARLLGVHLPGDPVWPALCGLLLLLLAGQYAAAALEPPAARRSGLVACAGRGAGAFVLLGAAVAGSGAVFGAAACADAVLALVHGLAAAGARGARGGGGAGPA